MKDEKFDDVDPETGEVYTAYDEYDEVLNLTQWNGETNSAEHLSTTIAEYDEINIIEIDERHKKTAQSFISKIARFVKEFKDVELTKQHESYITDVAKLQISNLIDLLTLTDVNRRMIDNIVKRINSVQADDYALVASYNSLVNQHLKLLRETQTMYKNVPSVIKKMRTEILVNQDIEETADSEDGLDPDNQSSFNSQKSLLRNLRNKIEKQNLPPPTT